jgi:hypothetical protein
MSNPTPKRSTPTALPEFMTSPSVGDFFAEWLDEQVKAYAAAQREQGNSRALGWELRTLERNSTQLAAFVAGLVES